MTVFKVNNRPATKSWNGLFNELFSDLEKFGNELGQPNAGSIPVNIFETENAFLLDVSAPGRNKEGFTLNVEDNLLTIGYEVKENAEKAESKKLRSEFTAKSFKRSFNLDDKVDAEKIEAKYEQGILTVTLPKKAEIKPEVKQITIQ